MPGADRLAPWLLFAAVLAAYWATRSLWLDEWDSIQFARGIERFDLWEHRPHPPGYPLYIFLGSIGVKVFGLDPVTALVLIGCASGALFVTAWFMMVRETAGPRLAWLLAATLAATPAIWMTSVKALTDMPAAAALAVQLLYGLRYRRSRATGDLLRMAAFGALVAGLRPQMAGVALVVLMTWLIAERCSRRAWAFTIGGWGLACLLWLVPVCWTQARCTPGVVDSLAYSKQLQAQWRWRLDKPKVYVGAAPLTLDRLEERCSRHLGWGVLNGLGMDWSGPGLVVYGVFWGGMLLCLLGSVLRRRTGPPLWRRHLPWALLLVFMVFCCLPSDQRYYVAVVPLLWLPVLHGWLSLPRLIGWTAALLPPAVLWVSLPLALIGHSVPPAPVQMLDFLKARHPPDQRGAVWLLAAGSHRHALWYGDGLRVMSGTEGPDAEQAAAAVAIYTDQPKLKLSGPLSDRRLVPVTEFRRPEQVYRKHALVRLYLLERIDRTNGSPPSR